VKLFFCQNLTAVDLRQLSPKSVNTSSLRTKGLFMPQIAIKLFVLGMMGYLLSGCSPQPKNTDSNQEVLAVQTQAAQFSLPRCTQKSCVSVDIQTLKTQDPWLNQWVEQHLANVVQQQVGQNNSLDLQQAVNVYVEKSASWQREFPQNTAYNLQLLTQIAAQHNAYVLLNIVVNSQQGDISVKQRQYFYVADIKQQKDLKILAIIQPKQRAAMDQEIQMQYQTWLGEQSRAVKQRAPKHLEWTQANWFFDRQGIGLHYRANEISPDGAAVSMYLSKQQTQAFLEPKIYQQMFAAQH